jgi:CCR4-NOT transcriptional regulation complex NOT5 subunit
VTGITAVPYRKYKNYLKDPEYIEFVHKRVIGMIKAWVQCIEETVKDIQQEWDYSWDAVKDQLYWARRLTDTMMVGLSKFKLFLVTVLNLCAVVELVEGVDDEEKADLVLQIANCKFCEVAIIRHIETNNVSIVTIYDHNNTHKVAYGKGSIKDLNHLEPADRDIHELEWKDVKKVGHHLKGHIYLCD